MSSLALLTWGLCQGKKEKEAKLKKILQTLVDEKPKRTQSHEELLMYAVRGCVVVALRSFFNSERSVYGDKQICGVRAQGQQKEEGEEGQEGAAKSVDPLAKGTVVQVPINDQQEQHRGLDREGNRKGEGEGAKGGPQEVQR